MLYQLSYGIDPHFSLKRRANIKALFVYTKDFIFLFVILELDMKVFLTGYMGSGKSTAGKKLAKELGMEFTDLDEYIEEQYGKTISAIFEEEGEEKFRALEHNYLKVLMNTDNRVISTGGGTPCYYGNMELMNSNGATVYLKMSVNALVQRLLSAKIKRPLIKDMSESDLRAFVSANLEKREDFYAMAHYRIRAKDLKPKELAAFIREKL